jgi:exosortase A-associated hydrolase 2
LKSAACVREAFFVETSSGARFCLFSHPGPSVKGGVLFVPPFAEELNKSRRMVAEAVRAFVEAGWAVLQLDLKGCGDSAGEFGEATWDDWVADVAAGWSLLAERLPSGAPKVVWSLRAGSLLVSDWLARNSCAVPCLMWQPVANGKQHLTQFLRIKAANELVGEADARGVIAKLRAEIAAERAVEVAGYELSPGLVSGLEASVLRPPTGQPMPLMVLEMNRVDQPDTTPAVAQLCEKWRAAGGQACAAAVQGPAFWQTQEIELAPAAIEPSVRFLRDCAS